MPRGISGVFLGLLLTASGPPALAGPQTGVPFTGDVSDSWNAPFTGAVPMMVGAIYAGGRSIYIDCTVAGNVSLLLFDGSILVIPEIGRAHV